MGGAVSTGRDNNDLVDNLVKSDYIKTELVEKVFRAVDRADYFLPTSRQMAYRDLAWKSGCLHISAPCIYSDVMEWLKLRAGLSFLNLGSGTGYLNTMAGLILGTGGINHGIELNSSVVDYAIEKLENFVLSSSAIDEFDFCFPKFAVGNCLCLSSNIQQYDRVYCGAACPKTYENNLKNLIKVGGILVMPISGKLLQIKRKSYTEWVTKNIQNVSFASLVTPAPEHVGNTSALGDITPPTLQELCRSRIRSILRNIVYEEKPHVKVIPKAKVRDPLVSRENGRGRRRISLPIRDDESDSEQYDFSFLHDLDRDTGSQEMNALLNLVLSMRQDVGYDNFHEERNEDENTDDSDQSNPSTIEENCGERSQSELVERSPPSLDNENIGVTTGVSNHTSSELGTIPSVESQEQTLNYSSRQHDEVEIHDAVNTNDSSTVAGCSIGYNVSSDNITSSPESSLWNSSQGSESNAENREVKSIHERKRHYSEGDDLGESDESVPSEIDSDVSSPAPCEKVKKMKRKSPPPPNEWDLRRDELSDSLKKKVYNLPLPISLKLYVNMNRQF